MKIDLDYNINNTIVMKARIIFTNTVSNFTYNSIRGGYTCDEDTRSDDKKMLFYQVELIEIK